jgi:hypothetical protein
MPNVLVLSFEGFSFSSRQLFPQLLPKLLSRGTVHESLSIRDARNYIESSWPGVILITDAVVTLEDVEARSLLDLVANYTKHGCTTIFMGFVAETVDHARLTAIFRDRFELRWIVQEESRHAVRLAPTDECMIRTASLLRAFDSSALFLSSVPAAHMVYGSSTRATTSTCAAFARTGLGKLGYVGDLSFGEESERVIVAMCHLDRPEDSLGYAEMDG